VVAGNGLAPLLLAPLSAWLLRVFATTTGAGLVEKGVSSTMVTLGIVVWLVVGALFWLIANPPRGFDATEGSYALNTSRGQESNWKPMLMTIQFWLLYLMYFAGAAAGLTFISVATDFGKKALGELAFFAVMALSLGNTSGRILAGFVSDKIGRQLTLFAEFVFQGLVIGLLFWLSKHGGGTWPVILSVLFMIGLNYGANLTLFPAACKDHFGIRYFGLNYGCLFTAFGLAGMAMPWLNGRIKDVTGNLDLSYVLIMIMMAVAALLALVSRSLTSRQHVV
jgi:OFA family oxalate/formate antiporter-like MFS transporter